MQLQVLGPVQATENGESVALGGPRQRAVASATDDGTVDIYSTETLQLLATVNVVATSVPGLFFDESNQLTVVTDGGLVETFDIAGSRIASAQLDANRTVFRSAAATGVLVTSDVNGTWSMFDLTSLAVDYSVEFAHRGSINALAISPAATVLATGGRGALVKLWDLETGQSLMTLTGAGAEISSLAFNEDGSLLVASSGDGLTRIYTLDPEMLGEIGRSKVTRSLSDAECRLYLRVDTCPTD